MLEQRQVSVGELLHVVVEEVVGREAVGFEVLFHTRIIINIEVAVIGKAGVGIFG